MRRESILHSDWDSGSIGRVVSPPTTALASSLSPALDLSPSGQQGWFGQESRQSSRRWTRPLSVGVAGWLCLGMLQTALIAEDESATESKNPYQLIPTRNAFGIAPPAPPAPPPPPPIQTPTEPPADVYLTGFSLWGGEKKVYLQVVPKGGKPYFLELGEGEFERGIDVLTIDPKRETASIKNSGQPMTVSFKDHGLKYTAPAPAQAARGRPGAAPRPNQAQQQARGGEVQRGQPQQRGGGQPQQNRERGQNRQAAGGPTIIGGGNAAAQNVVQPAQGGGNFRGGGANLGMAQPYGSSVNQQGRQGFQQNRPVNTAITPPLPPVDPSRIRR